MQRAANVTSGDRLDWHAIAWKHIYRTVKNLRQRIFRAWRDGDLKHVRSLEWLMLRSRANIFESVRRVTQVNQGKDTPGVDHIRVTTLEERAALCRTLGQLTLHQVHPVRWVYIPKRKGKRPLGIPTIVDRCIQAMVKNALEPFWEARFEGISYGFRPGRGCHDAIQQLFSLGRPNTKRPWVLDADIEGAFDHIGHSALLQALGNCPARGLIQQWLKAGYVEDAMRHPTDTGVPQGGVISPLLLNVSLHGIEHALGSSYTPRGTLRGTYQQIRRKLKALWRQHVGSPTVALINSMNPLIRGWSQYFRIGVASHVFRELDTFMFARAQRYMQRRHPRKSGWWRTQKYWGQTRGPRRDRWVFQDTERHAILRKFAWTRIVRHRLVPKTYSPDDPTLQDYWRQRRSRPQALGDRSRHLASRQQGLCPVCHQRLENGEDLHVHHVLPKHHGGTDDLANLRLVHATCHRQIHSTSAPLGVRRWLEPCTR